MTLVSLSLSPSLLPFCHIGKISFWCVIFFEAGYMLLCLMFQGRITVTGLLDREKGDMYTLTVVADDGGPKKDSTVVCLFFVNFIQSLPLFYAPF